MSAQENEREYRAMTDLDDAVGTLLDCGWSEADLRERVETLIEDARDD